VGRLGDFGASAAADLRASGRSGWIVFGLGVAGAVLLVIAEFSRVVYITVVTASCQDLAEGSLKDQCVKSGFERHHGALLIVGLLLIALSFGAAVGRSRPAAVAMIVLGLVPVGIWLFGDRHQVGKTGAIGADFSEARSHAGKAIPLELAGGALAIVGGLVGLRRRYDDG
jgi:hypothetical protein